MTDMMRAISQDVLGGPEVLHMVEVPRPSPGPGEVLVAVHAVGVNPTDRQHREHGLFLGEPPFTLGWDVSGVVEEVGLGVSVLEPGDEVLGMLPYPGGAGGYAEYVTGPARAFAIKPAEITHVEAAALPMVGLVAWQALVDTAHVQPGQRVLVHAAAGGIGHVALQVAKALGASVTGTATGVAKLDLVRLLGADEALDYRTVDVATVVRDVDVVLDPVGGSTRLRSLDTLVPGGMLVSTIPDGELATVQQRGDGLGLRVRGLIVEHDHAGLVGLTDLVRRGLLHPHVGATFPLAEAADAHAAGESGEVPGKIVLTVVPQSGGQA